MPNLFSLNLTSILTTLYLALPLNRTEFKAADSLDWRELSQQIRVFVLADVSLKAIVVGMKCLNPASKVVLYMFGQVSQLFDEPLALKFLHLLSYSFQGFWIFL